MYITFEKIYLKASLFTILPKDCLLLCIKVFKLKKENTIIVSIISTLLLPAVNPCNADPYICGNGTCEPSGNFHGYDCYCPLGFDYDAMEKICRGNSRF